jgi:hypothetical protein
MAKLNNQNRTPIGGINPDGGAIANPGNGGIKNPGDIIANPGGDAEVEGPILSVQDRVAEKYLTTMLHSQKLIAKLLTKKPTEKKANTIQKFIDKVKRPDTKILSEEFLAKRFGLKDGISTFTTKLQSQVQQHETELERFKSGVKDPKDTIANPKNPGGIDIDQTATQ